GGGCIRTGCLCCECHCQSRRAIPPCPAYNRCISVFVDTNDGGRLDANIDGESQRAERNHPKQDRQEHGAIGVRTQHAVVLVIPRVAGNLRDFLPQQCCSHCFLLTPSIASFCRSRVLPARPRDRQGCGLCNQKRIDRHFPRSG